MTLSYDLYWSFRSPYSYLLMSRLVALERDFDVACHVRPVYPLAVRTPEFFEQQDPLWVRYFMTDVTLKAIKSAIVQPQRFNELVRAADNKALALSRISLGLLRSVWNPDDERPTLVICDKHGGRNRYDDLLAEILDGQMLFSVGEARERSVYRVGSTELRFQMKAEANFPVALASLVCKYVRELSMDVFNQFWSEHIPGLKPTAGYPLDAMRFRQDIAEVQTTLGITNEILWRER